ncbi:uncharacterized protein NPIL_321471 [Nephila pilipes]|uniref:Uncharacterized protein n=1 Tax=Nephila pilipes TaxID=299642 RepID=A0A8X6NHJ9_NEPPI|nr:uncharacterized protein NPIL_321471 [Nephila pilipes]
MKSGSHFLGLILLWALVTGKGRSQSIIFDNEVDQVTSASGKSATVAQPAAQAERRLSLEDFFLNRNSQQEETVQPQLLQQPQAQVQQSDPNSVVLVRDAQLPSVNGGLLSRLLMIRRLMRLRRIARRIMFVPRVLGLGLRRPLRQASQTRPVVMLRNRIGEVYNEPYNPREYVFGNKAFSYNHSSPSYGEDYSSNEQKQSKRTYEQNLDPYDLPYDYYDPQNARDANNYEIEEGNSQYWNKQKQIGNDIDVDSDDYKKLQEYDAEQKIRQQLELLQKTQEKTHQPSEYQENGQISNYKSHLQNLPLNSQYYQPNPQQDRYLSNQEENNDAHHHDSTHPDQYKHNQQIDNANQYSQSPQINQLPQSLNELTREQQLQLLQQLQLFRDQQLKLLQLQQLQLQYQNQNQNYHQSEQYQNQGSQIESENDQETGYQQQQQNPESEGEQNLKTAIGTDSAEHQKSGTTSLGSATRITPGKNVIGVGVNVGIKPPAVDIAITKPVSPVIKPIPPIINPIVVHKPVVAAPVEQLVPIGFLPRPILKLNSRVFLGAEMGNGVKIGR